MEPLGTKPKMMRKKNIVRDPNTEENLAIAEKLKHYVDDMIKYKAHTTLLSTLRSRMTNYRGKYRLYAMSRLEKEPTYSTATSLGELMIARAPYAGVTNAILHSAMDRLGISDMEDKLYEEYKDYSSPYRHSAVVDTTALKTNIDVLKMEKTIFNEFYRFLETVDCSVAEDKYFASALAWMKENIHYHQKYLSAYQKARDLFIKESTKGLFPRLFTYKGVVYTWQEIREISSYTKRIETYISQKDPELYDALKREMMTIRHEMDEYRPRVTLDGYDYETDVVNEASD